MIQVARQLSVGDVELKEHMTGRQTHLGKIPDVPRADDVAPGVRVVSKRCEHVFELIDPPAVKTTSLSDGLEITFVP